MTGAEAIAEAQSLLTAGKEKDAARVLTDAAVGCKDVGEATAIRDLAMRGREQAGRFGKGRWDEVIRLANKHGAATPA